MDYNLVLMALASLAFFAVLALFAVKEKKREA